MPWCNPNNVRKIIGLEEDDVSDNDLSYYIENAQNELINDITSYTFEYPMYGDIDGVNTTFQTTLGPIADANFDNTVSISDVTVNKWGYTGSINTMVNCSLSTIYPEYGIVVLSSAPESTIEVVTMSFHYYCRHIDASRIPHVTALLSAYHYIKAEQLLLPKQWMHGAYRFMKGTAAEDLLAEYNREKLILLGKDSRISDHGVIKFNRDEF